MKLQKEVIERGPYISDLGGNKYYLVSLEQADEIIEKILNSVDENIDFVANNYVLTAKNIKQEIRKKLKNQQE